MGSKQRAQSNLLDAAFFILARVEVNDIFASAPGGSARISTRLYVPNPPLHMLPVTLV